jgi:hypothetical protein
MSVIFVTRANTQQGKGVCLSQKDSSIHLPFSPRVGRCGRHEKCDKTREDITMQNKSVKTLGIAMAGLLLISTWPLAAEAIRPSWG